MILSDSVVDERRCRLSNHERVGTSTGLSRLGGFLLGLVFVATGIFILLLSREIIPVDPSSFHAPHGVVTLFGIIFATSGALLWSRLIQERRLVRSRLDQAKQHPFSAAFADYPWDLHGTTKSPWTPVSKGVGAVIFMVIFLTPFNWWAWISVDSALMVKIIISSFDLILLLLLLELIRQTLGALKYGKSRLEYLAFPVIIGKRADLRWFPPSGLKNVSKITFVLRCVEEWMESSGSGDNRRTQLIHEQRWAMTRSTEGIEVACLPNYPVTLSFDLPPTVPGSKLADEHKITFWELEVNAEAVGIDFWEQYLVPVYMETT